MVAAAAAATSTTSPDIMFWRLAATMAASPIVGVDPIARRFARRITRLSQLP